MKKICDSWKNFCIVIINPWVLILVLISIGSHYYSIHLQNNLLIMPYMSLITSLVTGILGGIIAKKWDDLVEEKVIVVRAKSAIRSLNSLLGSIVALERRVRLYNNRYSDPRYKNKISTEVIKTYLEETVENCVGLGEQVINSIEDWKDIIPDLNVSTNLQSMRELHGDYNRVLLELAKVKKEYNKTKKINKEEKDRYEKVTNELLDKLMTIEKDLIQKSNQFGVPTISGSIISGSTDSIHPLETRYPLSAKSIVLDGISYSDLDRPSLSISTDANPQDLQKDSNPPKSET